MDAVRAHSSPVRAALALWALEGFHIGCPALWIALVTIGHELPLFSCLHPPIFCEAVGEIGRKQRNVKMRSVEDVQYLAGHSDLRTTRLYDGRPKQVTRKRQ